MPPPELIGQITAAVALAAAPILLVVEVNDYVHLVPYVEADDHLFLKPIIPSRKATRAYLHEERDLLDAMESGELHGPEAPTARHSRRRAQGCATGLIPGL
ncbi:MAG: hypothetical protein R6U00_08620 [Prochlorococcaceae cyanobacterium]